MRLAVLEDDPVIGKGIDRTMEAAGHHCHEFSSSRGLMKALREETLDLLLLDWNVPECDGLPAASMGARASQARAAGHHGH